MAVVIDDIWEVSSGDTETGAIDIGPYLDSGELVASVSVTEGSGDLTISNVQVSTGALTINGVSVPTGEAILFTFSGMTAGTKYTAEVEVTTDSTPARVKNYCQIIQTLNAC